MALVISNFVHQKIDIRMVATSANEYISPYIETPQGEVISDFTNLMSLISAINPEAQLFGKDEFEQI